MFSLLPHPTAVVYLCTNKMNIELIMLRSGGHPVTQIVNELEPNYRPRTLKVNESSGHWVLLQEISQASTKCFRWSIGAISWIRHVNEWSHEVARMYRHFYILCCCCVASNLPVNWWHCTPAGMLKAFQCNGYVVCQKSAHRTRFIQMKIIRRGTLSTAWSAWCTHPPQRITRWSS